MAKIKFIMLTACLIAVCIIYVQSVSRAEGNKDDRNYEKALVNYDDFKNLVQEVEKHRAERLISLEEFLKMSKEENTVILDSRSDYRYERKHIKGAIHLDFTDFTQDNLARLIPDQNTRILIYCNNNFIEDQVDFASKISMPSLNKQSNGSLESKPIMLALNIPTYLNLYGYGYRNVYELDELVNVKHKKLEFEGTSVK